MLRVLNKGFLRSSSLAVALLTVTACWEGRLVCRGLSSTTERYEVENTADWVDEEGNFRGSCSETCGVAYAVKVDYDCTVIEVIPEQDGAPNLGGNGGSGGNGGGGASESSAGTVVLECEPLEEEVCILWH